MLIFMWSFRSWYDILTKIDVHEYQLKFTVKFYQILLRVCWIVSGEMKFLTHFQQGSEEH